MMSEVLPQIRRTGFPVDQNRTLCMAAYVDNLFTMARSGNDRALQASQMGPDDQAREQSIPSAQGQPTHLLRSE